ncbi:MAG: DUF5312 domain-containing protein [Treponema sp.]|nr:DUF5312 domain-containing protein [Treponema sp.]
MDAELRAFEPAIYKNGSLLPNFGEAIFTLYKCTKPFDDLFLSTLSPLDIQRKHRFEAQLITTGYDGEFQEILDNLSFENRKEQVLAEAGNAPERVYLRQRNMLERTLKELNSDNFKRMDKDILALRQFVDFCAISFVPVLQIFDLNFIPDNFSYKPTYAEIPVEKAVNLLEDLYYQIADMHITTSLADEITAVAQLRKGGEISNKDMDFYLSNLKKINFVITKILSAEKLKKLICYAKRDLNFEPRVAAYAGSPRQEFANLLQSRFDAEEQRIKTEIQDERIGSEVSNLFKGITLEELVGYNSTINSQLQANTPLSFMWILPMRILKTFLNNYLTENIKGLLNDVVIEGFFNNPSYKSEFSTTVYAAINAYNDILEFEQSFGEAQVNSTAVMQSYMKDSHKDKDFYRKLEKMVVAVNNEAHKILQSVTSTMLVLYKDVGELLADSKKPSSEIISNLKVLMMSSRNKDNTNSLELQYANWKIFFEIMKNYVIINTSEII